MIKSLKDDFSKDSFSDLEVINFKKVGSVATLIIDDKKGIFDEDVIYKDTVKTTLDLELSLVSACIILRKMSENLYITIPNDLRRDLNSIIHSNRFDYDDMLVVYSQRGREEIDLDSLLHFCRTVLSFDKVHG